jgi:hypothetical protein
LGRQRFAADRAKTGCSFLQCCADHYNKTFKALTVMACDDKVIPLQSRIESVMDECVACF